MENRFEILEGVDAKQHLIEQVLKINWNVLETIGAKKKKKLIHTVKC